MKITLFVVSLFFSVSVLADGKKDARNEYLRRVLSNLEKIESATYYTLNESWQPGDTVPVFVGTSFLTEYNNPSDTTIGASFIIWNGDDTTKFEYGYDGHIKAVSYHEDQRIILDNFSTNKLPFRIVLPPFFNYTRNIINYALTTNDRIDVELKENNDHYFFRLTINEETTVDFLGKAYHLYKEDDPTSIFEIWINKSSGLPYKWRREMQERAAAVTCSNLEVNKLSLKDFDIYAYFPQNYEVRKRWEKQPSAPDKQTMEGEKAPGWTLNNTNGNPVSLSDLKSKVLLINFTGIGCGPCGLAIPLLKSLKERFGADEFDVMAIESWARKPQALKVYSDKNELNYMMVGATEEVLKNYKTGGATPVFLLLDEQRVIRKVFQGYSKERSDKEMLKAIQEMLK